MSPSRTTSMPDLSVIAAYQLDAWAPLCERIEIAGSLRRGKSDPHDIEIVAVPKVEQVGHEDLFGTIPRTRNLFEETLAEWLAKGALHHRRDKNGRAAWGERFKRATIHGCDIAIDIFSVLPPAQWGVIFAIRTGPADFNRLLVTSRLQGGFMPGGMQVRDGMLWQEGQVLETPEEEAFFERIGVPCWPPEDRSLLRLAQWRQGQRERSGAR